MYCVYLTIYSGNKIPKYYIGSSRREFDTCMKVRLFSESKF